MTKRGFWRWLWQKANYGKVDEDLQTLLILMGEVLWVLFAWIPIGFLLQNFVWGALFAVGNGVLTFSYHLYREDVRDGE